MNEPPIATPGRSSLGDIARVFLKLGTVAFGGPAAHIAMMEEEVVRRRGWLTREEFLDYLGATNLIPGPNSTELAIHVGHARGGWPGLLVAGISFIMPAALIVTAIAWGYVRYGALPAVNGMLHGLKPVVIAIVMQALWMLGRTAFKSRELIMLYVAAFVAVAVGVHELVVLSAAAAIAMLLHARARREREGDAASTLRSLVPALSGGSAEVRGVAGLGAAATAAASAAIPFGLWPLFLVFVKIGAVLFGSGYVLLAFLRADLVTRLGWLTERQLLDALVVGQVTPGPVFTTATFIGYLLGGGRGAAVATIGIFLPAFVFVALSSALVPRIRRSPMAGAALDGVNVASLALMALVTAQLARSVLVVDPVAIAIAGASLVALLRYRVSSAWLVLAGAAIGLVMS